MHLKNKFLKGYTCTQYRENRPEGGVILRYIYVPFPEQQKLEFMYLYMCTQHINSMN